MDCGAVVGSRRDRVVEAVIGGCRLLVSDLCSLVLLSCVLINKRIPILNCFKIAICIVSLHIRLINSGFRREKMYGSNK